VYLHDHLLHARATSKTLKALPAHDEASLAYTILKLVDTDDSFPCARKHTPADLVTLRRKWLTRYEDASLVAAVKDL
jgi:hypothetical protein